MKNSKLQILLFATVTIASLAAKKDKDSVLDSINQRAAYIAKQVTLLNEKQKCSTVIMQSDVGTTGYVISEPGDYCLGEDIVFNPANPVAFNSVTFTDPTGTGAVGLLAVSDGTVRGLFIANGGMNYTPAPTVTITDSTGSGATAQAYVDVNGGVSSIVVTNYGDLYYTAPTAAITGVGSGATATVQTDGDGIITGITVTNPGTGYPAPTVTINGPGSGATVGSVAVTSAGQIFGATINNGGTGYQNTVQAAITIKASNVNLQLNNHRLSQAGSTLGADIPNYSGATSPSAQTPFVVGILIPDTLPTDTNVNDVGLASIYISGDQAMIDGFSMYGVRVLGHTADVRLSNLTIENCGLLASYYLRPFSGYVPNGYTGLTEDTSQILLGIGGLCIGESDIFGMGPEFFTQNSGIAQNRVNSVVMNSVTCLNNFSLGLCISNATDIYISGCHFDGTLCDDPALFVIGGGFGIANVDYEAPSNNNMVVENSTFNGTNMRGDYMTEIPGSPAAFLTLACAGSACARSNNISFDNCHFDNTSCTFAGDLQLPFICASWNDSLQDVTWSNCSFSDLQTLACNGPIGLVIDDFDFYAEYRTSSDNLRFINCVASNIQQNGNLQLPAPIINPDIYQAYGFVTFSAKNVYFENCIASDIIVNGPMNANSYSAGFLIEDGGDIAPEDEADNTVLRGCIAQRIRTTQGGNAIGFWFAGVDGAGNALKTIVVEDCIAEGCMSLIPTFTINPVNGTPFGNMQGNGIGFISMRASNTDFAWPITYNGCKALHCKGLPTVATEAGTQYSAGFYSTGTGQSGSLPIQIQAYYNCEALDNVYGFLLQNDTQCIVRNCRSDLNVADDGMTGEGFTDLGLGTSGTTTAPLQSFSLFESNKAFENGAGDTHFGANGNYNVLYGNPANLDYVPTLTGNLTYPTAIGGSFFPQANYIAHNLSITQS